MKTGMTTIALTIALSASGSASALLNDEGPGQVAIATEVRGQAWASTETKPRHLLQVFEWLVPGTLIEVGRSSEAIVVFNNGARYSLGSQTRGRVTLSGIVDRVGRIRELAQLPPLPSVAPLPPGAPPTTSGAVRIRGNRWPMFPSGSATALASGTVLRFAPLPRADRYFIQLVDSRRSAVFTATTTHTVVSVPPTVLEPGRSYTWAVHALDATGEFTSGDEPFTTLTDEEAARRQTFAARVANDRDPALLALLGFLDAQLGLLVDARAELRSAVARGYDGSRLSELRAALDTQLESIPNE